MFFSQANSAARPAIIETKFNPFSIVKAGLVSEMMDDGLPMNKACRKAGMSSATYRHALLAGKAQPPKHAVIWPARFSDKTVDKYLSMESLMARGFLQSQAATEVGASSECYSVWRLQTAVAPFAAPVREASNKRYDPVQTITEEVRGFAAKQSQQTDALDVLAACKAARDLSEVRMVEDRLRISTNEYRRALRAQAALAHRLDGGRHTAINADGLGADWRIKSVKREDTKLIVKAVLSDSAQEMLHVEKANGTRTLVSVMGILSALSSLSPNCFSDKWKVDKIVGGLDGITATCSHVEKTAARQGGEAYQRAIRAVKAEKRALRAAKAARH